MPEAIGVTSTDGSGGVVVRTLRLPVRHGEPAGPLRTAIRLQLEPGCPGDTIEDVMVVVSELVQNVTQHTRGDGELVVIPDRREVLIEVSDTEDSLPNAQPPDDRRIGGRGLLVVGRIAHEWGSRRIPGGKVVWARVTVPVDDPAELVA